MKTKKVLYFILMFLPLVLALLSLPFLPDQIPAHYGANNQVTRWGSKYEVLIFPGITIAFGFIMLAVAKYAAKQEKDGTNNEKLCILTGILSLVLFNVMTGFFLYTDFKQTESLPSIPVDINQLTLGILGIALIIIGNVMPKARMNSVIGLRTSWSMKNEATWKKSQR